MYDRYGREAHVNYVQAAADDRPLPPPPHGSAAPQCPPPPVPPPPEGTMPVRGLLAALHLEELDSGDLLLLALLFFLFRQKADEELLIAIGLLLIL